MGLEALVKEEVRHKRKDAERARRNNWMKGRWISVQREGGLRNEKNRLGHSFEEGSK